MLSQMETFSNTQSSVPHETIQEEASTQTSTITLTTTHDPQTVRLRLTRKLSQNSSSGQNTVTRRRVSWTTDTVDNEFLNKKKSKCCCVYHKPKNWNESSSEDENEDHDCQNCRGHRKSDYNHVRDNKDKPESNESSSSSSSSSNQNNSDTS